MRPTRIILLVGMLAFLSSQLRAQSLDESVVKIVPTSDPGIIKIIYGAETWGPVKVTFVFNNKEVTDKIEVGSYPKGVSKRYDIRSIKDGNYWIKISSPQLTITYRMTPSRDGVFSPYLEKSTYYQGIVRRN